MDWAWLLLVVQSKRLGAPTVAAAFHLTGTPG